MSTTTPYRIELRGRVAERTLGPYADDFVIARTSTTTTISGVVRDAAHLHGIVTHLTGIGLELVSVHPLTDADMSAGADDQA